MIPRVDGLWAIDPSPGARRLATVADERDGLVPVGLGDVDGILGESVGRRDLAHGAGEFPSAGGHTEPVVQRVQAEVPDAGFGLRRGLACQPIEGTSDPRGQIEVAWVNRQDVSATGDRVVEPRR